MLTKFESKSNRVKGLCFHATRPWVLTSLHNGVIQLWDYRMGTLLDRFDEHDGPVRGVDFHRTQPLFVSGGDDYKIKVWDYKLRRCLFTLLGHLDYIRTVHFHHEYPWIVSCSDDQTIRIWNWQSRSCVSVLTGHNHYVMCASFHPKEDLIVSASLDQTVRVWDTTGLRKKTVRGAPSTLDDAMLHSPSHGGSARSNSDVFGSSDAVVKYVLEGHDRGVNWASFHPTLPLIVSGADDRQVKLWRMNETKAWEVDTMRGHTNNISCVIFHPKHELIISNSEDRSIRVWDISKRMGLQTFRRENDRFWILQAHPMQNLLAAGHDSGMIIFKLERERPAMDLYENHTVYYVKERYIRRYRFNENSDQPVATIRRTGAVGTGMGNVPRFMHFNPYDSLNTSTNSILLTSDAEGGSYELVTFTNSSSSSTSNDTSDSTRGNGLFAVFIARQRFAVLDKSRHLIIKNMQNEIVKKITPPNGTADGLFPGGTVGRVLLRMEDKVILYDTDSRRVLSDIQASRVKYVIWNSTFDFVALMSKHSIVIADKQLKYLCTITESVRVKSGIWSSSTSSNQNALFVYTTLNHIKYTLSNGDSGILRTLDVPVYLTSLQDNNLHCLDREHKMRTLQLDLTECQFKMYLMTKQFNQVMHMVKHSRLCGQAIISYLTSKGYPEVALHFVHDEKTKFKLAISCGNLEVALNAAYEVDDINCWHQLGTEALRQGNVQVVEMAYQRTKNFEKLSFLYLMTGNREKLKKMLKIAELRQDVMSRFHNALYLGDVLERVRVLESAGQLALALLTASTYGLHEEMERLTLLLEQVDPAFQVQEFLNRESLSAKNGGSLLMPPFSVLDPNESENWPLVEDLSANQSMNSCNADMSEATAHGSATSGDPAATSSGSTAFNNSKSSQPQSSGPNPRTMSDDFSDANGGAWDDEEDSLFSDNEEFHQASSFLPDGDHSGDHVGSSMDVAVPGVSVSMQWAKTSSVAANHIAAGSFESAMQLLHRQIGIVNFKPLKPYFLKLYTSCRSQLPTQGHVPTLPTYIHSQNLPYLGTNVVELANTLKEAYRAFSGAKFDDVIANCLSILYQVPLLSLNATEKDQVGQVKELVLICREYLLACHLRNALNDVNMDSDPKRYMELSAYMTHCQIQPSHLLLTLKSAMTCSFKCNNFITAGMFCKRLLSIPEIQQERHVKTQMTARKVLQKSEKEARNEYQIEYTDARQFQICSKTFTILNETKVHCPYCGANYKREFRGQACNLCGLSKIGEETIGLVVSNAT